MVTVETFSDEEIDTTRTWLKQKSLTIAGGTKEVQLNIKAAEDKNLDWIIWNNSSQYEIEYFTKIES